MNVLVSWKAFTEPAEEPQNLCGGDATEDCWFKDKSVQAEIFQKFSFLSKTLRQKRESWIWGPSVKSRQQFKLVDSGTWMSRRWLEPKSLQDPQTSTSETTDSGFCLRQGNLTGALAPPGGRTFGRFGCSRVKTKVFHGQSDDSFYDDGE